MAQALNRERHGVGILRGTAMRLHTDPMRFSITAFLADQVTLVARHEHISPGAAVLRVQELMRSAEGRARLLSIVEDEWRRETDPAEIPKIAAVRMEMAAWLASHEARPDRRPPTPM